MTVDDLKKHYGCKSLLDLSKKIDKPSGVGTGVSNVTLHKWKREGIPPRTQAFYEVKTKGQLKADC